MSIKNEKITIIVPVYNVERYLQQCIESLINQSYENLEIILVNDGSTDASGEICDKYSSVDNRVKVIHKKNEGVSIARNTGLKEASGEYIAFVDGDDFLDKDIYFKLFQIINNSKYDLVMCRFYKSFSNRNNVIENEPLKEGEYKKEEIFKKLILPMIGNSFKNTGKELIMGAVWRCLYKKEIIEKNRIEFPIIKIAEDMLFHLNYLGYCNCVYILEEALYFYRFNEMSATRKYITSLWETLQTQINMVRKILINFNLLNREIEERLESNTFYFISWCFTNECHPGNPKKYKQILEHINDIKKSDEFKKVFNWKNILNSPIKERCIFICIKLGIYKPIYIYNNKKFRANN